MTQSPDPAPLESSSAFSGLIHGTTVVLGGHAIMIRGESGSGKSDLALRLIDRGAILLSDDYTGVAAHQERIVASTAPNIAGLIEVRGIGPVAMSYAHEAALALIVALAPSTGCAPDRYPPERLTTRLCGVDLPLLRLRGLEASAPIKVELALKAVLAQGTPP